MPVNVTKRETLVQAFENAEAVLGIIYVRSNPMERISLAKLRMRALRGQRHWVRKPSTLTADAAIIRPSLVLGRGDGQSNDINVRPSGTG